MTSHGTGTRVRKIEMDIKFNVTSGPSEGNLSITECCILLEGGKEHVKSWRIEIITL